MRRLALLVVLGLAVTLAACASDETSTPTTASTALPAGTTPGATGDVGSLGEVRPAVEPTGTVTHASLTMPDGAERTYRLYLPSTFDPEVPTPLLVALHGGLGWGDQFAETNHVEGLAEANGFVVVHPASGHACRRARGTAGTAAVRRRPTRSTTWGSWRPCSTTSARRCASTRAGPTPWATPTAGS